MLSTGANLAAQDAAPARNGIESLRAPRFLESNKPTNGSGRQRVASTYTSQALGRQRGAPSRQTVKRTDGGRPRSRSDQLYNT